jgi:hypothetical protein
MDVNHRLMLSNHKKNNCMNETTDKIDLNHKNYTNTLNTNSSSTTTNSCSHILDSINRLKQKNKDATIVPIDKDAPSYDQWFHGQLSRLRSEELLRDEIKPGSFLLRESQKNSGAFVLSYHSFNGNIFHFK